VVITTGAKPRMLHVGEEKFLGRGVSTCAVCDAAFFKDKVTYLVGGGDSALEDVLALARHAKSVILVHRRDELRASKIMQERVLVDNKDKVKILWNTEVKGVEGDDKLEAIFLENNKDGKRRKVKTDGLFLAIGHIPETEIFRGQVELDEKGYLLTHLNGLKQETGGKFWLKGYPTRTSVMGVFGFGCMAALDTEKYLTGQFPTW
jgi:thioredoxin reductase (NADPH)